MILLTLSPQHGRAQIPFGFHISELIKLKYIIDHLNNSNIDFEKFNLIDTRETKKLQLPIFLQLYSEIRRLAKNPEEMYLLSPRKFEELVAELLKDMGQEVILTPQTHDGGRDILAICKTPALEFLTIIDCKKYSLNRPVGPDVVQRLLWVSDRNDKASHAMIATTSRFTKGAVNLANDYRWKLSLKDHKNIHDWLCNYGFHSKEYIDNLWAYTRDA